MFSVIAALLIAGVLQDVPLPAALLSAKTARVENLGVKIEDFEKFVAGLRHWNRLQIVETDSDIVITLDGKEGLVYNAAINQNHAVTKFFMTFKSGDTVLYTDQLRGCCSMKSMVKKTIERLEKRMKEQERARLKRKQ